MTDDSASTPRQLGDYLLKERLVEDDRTVTWLAEQVSISRSVLLEELRESQLGRQRELLSDVRAKAAVDHPLIGSVYEAVADPGRCFYTYELLPGDTLSMMKDAGAKLKPARLTRLLHRICEANLYYESHDRASEPLTLEDIHVNEHDVVRLRNLAAAGPRPAEHSARDIAYLGAALVPLVAEGEPGSTRMFTLLGWMRGKELPKPLHWLEIINLCEQIDQQLAGPLPAAKPTRPAGPGLGKRPITLLACITGIALFAVIFLALKMRPGPPAARDGAEPPAPVSIAAGDHPAPDGGSVALPGFVISAHEITIGQYAAFLDTLDLLAAEGRQNTFDHPDQPEEKAGHLPDDWAALLSAAKARGLWRDMPVTLHSPVTGVDWWDAVAYADWKQGRLPTQEEWFAALRHGGGNPQAIPTSTWLPVTAETPDRTPSGMLAMAGSLAEWTRDQAANPSNPLGQRFWVIIGGSYARPGSNALSREWVDDRSLRRPDLGFRVLWDEK